MAVILGKKCFRIGKIFQKSATDLSGHNFRRKVATDIAAFITPESHPGNHSKSDIGLFYTISNSISFDSALPGRTLVKAYIEECKTFNETPILIRKPALDIINCLKNTNYNSAINRYLIYGKFGSGKSMVLAHLIYYAYMSDWLIVHFPRLTEWLYSRKEIAESSTVHGCIDIPDVACGWLIHFNKQNEKFFKKNDITIINDYKWNTREENKKGDSLLSLVNYGITRPKYACDVINAVLNEIKLNSKIGEFKTLIAVDGFNFIFQPHTKIKNIEKKFVSPEQISCISAIKNMAQADWHNGAAILTCETMTHSNDYDDYLPMYTLGVKGFEFLDPFIPIEIPALTEKEMTSILTYYRSKKWLLKSNGDQELKFLCAGNALRLRLLCGPL